MQNNSYKDLVSQITLGQSKIDFSNISLKIQELINLYVKIKENSSVGYIIWGKLPKGSELIVKQIESQLVQNNKQHQTNPNDFIHMLLSLHSYEDFKEVNGLVEFSEIDTRQYNKYLKNWRIEEIFDDEGSSYHAVLYINRTTKQTVLAHQGTKIAGKTKCQQLYNLFARNDSDLQTDLKGVFGKELVEQQIKAYEAMGYSVNQAKKHSYNLSTTGHSLGAWLAEMSGYYAYKDFKYQAKIVNFDSPGSVAHIEGLGSNIKNSSTKIDFSNINIITYLSRPNLVNCCNLHLGKVYCLFPEIPKIEDLTNSLSWLVRVPIIGEKIKENSFVLNGILSLSGHGLRGLVKTFDPITMKPLKCKEVLNWPTIKYVHKESITDQFVDAITNYIPTPISAWLFSNGSKKVLNKCANNLFGSTINIISHFLSGNIDLSNYFELYKNIENESSPQVIKHSPYFEDFSLVYKSSYKVIDVDPYSAILNTANKGSIDWYLSRLKKYSDKKIKRNFSEFIAGQLLNLKQQYKITLSGGKKHISSQYSEYTIELITAYMSRLIMIEEKLAEQL